MPEFEERVTLLVDKIGSQMYKEVLGILDGTDALRMEWIRPVGNTDMNGPLPQLITTFHGKKKGMSEIEEFCNLFKPEI